MKESSDVGIAVFVKTPGVSPLKTRLAAGVGAAYAEQWYLLAAEAVAEAAADSGAQLYWAVAEPEGLHAELWRKRPRLCQAAHPTSSLGERMHDVMRQLLTRHKAGILLGADTPHFSSQSIEHVADWLNHAQPRQALARALDGGFWLYGANRLAPLAAWNAVHYSQADTADQFCAVMAHFGEFSFFPVAQDVDTASDLDACLAALQTLAQPTPAQQSLLVWMLQPHSSRVS